MGQVVFATFQRKGHGRRGGDRASGLGRGTVLQPTMQRADCESWWLARELPGLECWCAGACGV